MSNGPLGDVLRQIQDARGAVQGAVGGVRSGLPGAIQGAIGQPPPLGQSAPTGEPVGNLSMPGIQPPGISGLAAQNNFGNPSVSGNPKGVTLNPLAPPPNKVPGGNPFADLRRYGGLLGK